MEWELLCFVEHKIFGSEFTSESLNSPLGAQPCSIAVKEAKSCKVSDPHVQIPGLVNMSVCSGDKLDLLCFHGFQNSKSALLINSLGFEFFCSRTL